MPSTRAELARIAADLVAAQQRREDLLEEWGYAKYAQGWSRRAEDVEVEQARVEAEIVALEERQAELEGAPANDVAQPSAPARGSPPEAAHDPPENVDPKTAARILGVSTDTLDRKRARGEQDPPWFKVGRLVRYPVAGLRGGTGKPPSGAV